MIVEIIMNKGLLALAQMIANKSGIDPFSAIEAALATVAATKFPKGSDLRVAIDKRTGEYKTFRRWHIISDETDLETIEVNQIPLTKAKAWSQSLEVGDIFEEEVPSIDFSRIDAQLAKRLINAEIRKAERNQIVEAYRARIGEVLTGTVRRQQLSREGITLELEEGIEVFLPNEEMIPREEIRLNDRVSGYLYKVESNPKGPQLFISRTATQLLAELFKLKVLEVEAGVIEIKAVARDPGSRAKVAVKTNDGRLNPIGTCIGRSGERVQAISNELNEEHIDIILWDENPAQLAIHAIAPAEVKSITIDDDAHSMDIIVDAEHLPRAIGRNGQNVRLASDLTGWTLNIMSTEDAAEKNLKESTELESFFIEQFNIPSELAKALVDYGFSTLEEIAYVAENELAAVPGLDEEMIATLQERAKDLLLAKALLASNEPTSDSNKGKEDLSNLMGVDANLVTLLNEQGITTREELAELATDELLEMAPLTREQAGQIIMNARAHWFKKS